MRDPGWISGDQIRTVPVGDADRVTIHFSEDVTNINTDSLFLRELLDDAEVLISAPTGGGYAYDPATRIATWTFSKIFDPNQHYLSISDVLTDSDGQQLDGDWVNPFRITTVTDDVSRFPSGNGTAGGDFNFVFTILPGDSNRDNIVDGGDFLSGFQLNVGGPGHTFQQFDFNGDGYTDSADLAIWGANHIGNSGLNLHNLIFADFNQDFAIDSADFGILSDGWVNGDEFSEGDANQDGDVDFADLMLMANQWGLTLTWADDVL